MRRDTRAGRHGTERGVDAAGDYARKRTAGWLLGALEQRVEMSSGFFQCLGWATGGLNGFVARLEEKARGMKGARDMVEALRGLHALQSGQSGMAYACEEFFASQARLQEIARECAAEACRACMARPADDGMYVTAGRRLSQVFGLEEESCLVCEFIFMIQQFPEVESYFEDELKAFRIGSRRLLSGMLGISASAVRRAVDELLEFGMVDVVFASSLRLTESVLAFWEPEAPALDELFFRLLEGETLPLRDFFIPEEQIRHVLRLLRKPGGEPVHVLFYGASGTGKTSFVRSLARECGVKAWAVTSRDKDSDADRRASLTACLHMASRQEGSFVVVDEAERLLDTGMVFGRNAKDKAWLNALLERPGRRVIWISNEVGHIDPAVRRRFSFSIHFERLGVRERVEVWRQVLKRAGLARRFSAPVMRDLSVRYPVEAAVIQKDCTVRAGRFMPRSTVFFRRISSFRQTERAVRQRRRNRAGNFSRTAYAWTATSRRSWRAAGGWMRPCAAVRTFVPASGPCFSTGLPERARRRWPGRWRRRSADRVSASGAAIFSGRLRGLRKKILPGRFGKRKRRAPCLSSTRWTAFFFAGRERGSRGRTAWSTSFSPPLSAAAPSA